MAVQQVNSFWGNPTLVPRNKDVAKFLESIRSLTKGQSDKRALGLATSALEAIVMFVAHRFTPREALALLDSLKNKVSGQA